MRGLQRLNRMTHTRLPLPQPLRSQELFTRGTWGHVYTTRKTGLIQSVVHRARAAQGLLPCPLDSRADPTALAGVSGHACTVSVAAETLGCMSSPAAPGHRTYRFHRPLTHAELAAVLAASRKGGVSAGIPALWDVILLEAEGMTWNEAIEQGQRFEPGRYAIPAEQAEAVRRALERHGADFVKVEAAVALAWLDVGPATF